MLKILAVILLMRPRLARSFEQAQRKGQVAMICDGCGREISEGQHCMKMRIEFGTRMPEGWQPVQHVDPTIVELNLHGPGCFVIWAEVDPIIRNVFAR